MHLDKPLQGRREEVQRRLGWRGGELPPLQLQHGPDSHGAPGGHLHHLCSCPAPALCAAAAAAAVVVAVAAVLAAAVAVGAVPAAAVPAAVAAAVAAAVPAVLAAAVAAAVPAVPAAAVAAVVGVVAAAEVVIVLVVAPGTGQAPAAVEQQLLVGVPVCLMGLAFPAFQACLTDGLSAVTAPLSPADWHSYWALFSCGSFAAVPYQWNLSLAFQLIQLQHVTWEQQLLWHLPSHLTSQVVAAPR